MQNGKRIRLDELRSKSAGEAEIDGEWHNVLQMTFETHHALNAAEGNADSFDVIKETVRKVVPTLSADALGRLTPEMAQVLLTLSGAGIEAVERMFPNVVGPEAAASTSPA